MPTIKLTERQQLMKGFLKRIAFRKAKLKKTRQFHREIEDEILKKIRLDEMQLEALKK